MGLSLQVLPYVLPLSTSSSVIWSPEHELWQSSLQKPSTPSLVLPLRHKSSPQHPVAKHTQQLCPRRQRLTLRKTFLRTAGRVHRQLDGATGLQKWWATDTLWTCTHEKPIEGIPPVITSSQSRSQIYYEMSLRDEWHNFICTATSAVCCYCGQGASTKRLHVAQMWRHMYTF
jgi:hypothetical protein